MKIKLSKYAGFCPGVKRADKMVSDLISKKAENIRVYTLGHLIHNNLYNSELEAKGVKSIEVEEVEGVFLEKPDSPMTVIIRTHGITKDNYERLTHLESIYPNLHIHDATCGFVKKIHRIADENTSDNTFFLLYCTPEHPEAVGIMSYARGDKIAFSSMEELKEIELNGKTPILCAQTTQNLVQFKKIKNFLKKLCTNTVFF